jgi:hypothetical protein
MIGPARAAVVVAALVAMSGGCAMLKNTPEQDYVWELGRICDARVAFWKMDEVKADGSYVIRGATNAPPGRDDYFACMKEQFAREPYGRWLALRSRAAAEGRPGLGAGARADGRHAEAIVVPVLLADKYVLVPVVLNRSEGGTFLLDTGSVTILTPEAARRAGVAAADNAPTRAVYILGGQRVDVPFVRLRSLEIGGALLEDVEVGVYAVAPQSPIIDGLLGTSLLDRFTVSVDSAAKQLRLEPRAR